MRPILIPVIVLFAGCIDPVHNDAVDALGGEVQGLRPGPTHRPGQPCLTCHGSEGPASPEMSVAGTVFEVRDSTIGIPNVLVSVTDATRGTQNRYTNGTGNFYIFKQEWDPVFPLHVQLSSSSVSSPKTMTGPIGREGSCATCHVAGESNLHMPGVFLRDQ
jgi:hypothetical protein